MTVRDAACGCGGLKIRLSGEPQMVSSCACQACQRRTGTPFAVVAFYPHDQVVGHEGEPAIFERIGVSGLPLIYRFCRRCGASVWWEPRVRPGMVAIAVGCFADKDFPPPERMIWTRFKADWVRPPDGAAEYEGPPP